MRHPSPEMGEGLFCVDYVSRCAPPIYQFREIGLTETAEVAHGRDTATQTGGAFFSVRLHCYPSH